MNLKCPRGKLDKNYSMKKIQYFCQFWTFSDHMSFQTAYRSYR